MPDTWRHVCARNSIGRFFAVAIMALTIICSGCDSKPAGPVYNGPATSTPVSAAKRARMVIAIKKHIAKYYKSVPVLILYDDLVQLPKLRKFLLRLGFIYKNGSSWRFTKRALAQASEVRPDGADFFIARGTYDHLDIVQYMGSTGSIGANSWDVGYFVKVRPTNQLGQVFAASRLLRCSDGSREHIWGSAGGTAGAVIEIYDASLSIAYEDVNVTRLDCPETLDRSSGLDSHGVTHSGSQYQLEKYLREHPHAE